MLVLENLTNFHLHYIINSVELLTVECTSLLAKMTWVNSISSQKLSAAALEAN